MRHPTTCQGLSRHDPSQRARQTVYQDTVINYFTKEKGQALTVSDDQAFCTQLRLTLSRELGVTEVGAIAQFPNPAQMVRCLNELPPTIPRPCFFWSASSTDRIRAYWSKNCARPFPTSKSSSSLPRCRANAFYCSMRLGADNVIAKPVSANTLIEKMAFTLKPQSRIGQAIDLARSLLQQKKKYAAAQDACAKILALKPGSAAPTCSWAIPTEKRATLPRPAPPAKPPPAAPSSTWPPAASGRALRSYGRQNPPQGMPGTPGRALPPQR